MIEKSSSIYLSSPKIALCYEKDETVNMFVNLEKSYAEVRYSDFYGFLSSDETAGKTIDEILPFNGGFAGIYLENGEKFAVVTQTTFFEEKFEKIKEKIPLED